VTFEQDRVAAIAGYDLIDQPPQEDLVAVARLAARIAGVDTATINILDDRYQHQVATAGFVGGRTSREASMCNTSIAAAEPVYLPDAAADARFAGNPWVTGELAAVRFYAASQLRTPDGFVVGTLCVFDESVRTLDDHQRRALDDLAEQIVGWLELRRRQGVLEQALGELERSNADLAAFAGRVAHDLRNPLTAVIGFLSLAERRFNDEMSERLRGIVATSLESAHRMASLVDDMLTFATVGAEPTLAHVDLRDLATAVVVDCEAQLTAAAARVDLRPLPTVTTDATLLRALLQNLVANATKFTRAGVDPLIVVVGGGDDERGWWLSVADNGRGIPAAERITVFEPFARASNSRGAQGTGIGLATCARIASRLGARLDVDETPGGGATFTVSAAPAA
jgi:signal transduction histidine kinase